MTSRRYFTPATFAFLRDLAANNDRDWFKAHQDRYESVVREPAIGFIEDFAEPLGAISRHFSADPRKAGGSLFRIQRDTRFSTDKTPYKTNTGMQFRHVAAKDAHAPGFYLHIEPAASFAGVGLWRPEAKVANQIREAIVAEPSAWREAAHTAPFCDVWSLGGDSLKRPPRGFDPEHPLVDDLKRKDFIASVRLSQKQLTSPGFLRDYTQMCTAAVPFMRFLCRAVGVAF